MFLHTVGYDQRNSATKFTFIRSGKTVSRYLHSTLNAMMGLYKEVFKQACTINSPTRDSSYTRSWHHYFELRMAPTYRKVYLRWDEKMDTIFINTLLEQRQYSQKTAGGWSLMEYNKASFNLKREANLDVTTEQCKTWWKTLKENLLLVKKNVESSGFGWNEETQLRNPSVKNYRDKAIPHYRDLDILVGKDYATGAEAGKGNDETNIPQQGVESAYFTIDERTPNRASSLTTPAGASAPSTGASTPKKNRVRRDSLDRADEAIEKLALAADKLARNV
ncbi:hypothetical protein GIB67_021624 [Kingdonia uniflora]|uniref:Myb/SANT-like domain-containing protein n=1 Tax=Kingdonia uniflora TaxID=39325 RepID=A0A7J7MDL2_9MAGN|nr:hypothetical protein GIB67_021624 [Kingdonia uniflora]